MIRVCTLNSVTLDVRTALDCLDSLQKKFEYQSEWNPFFLGVVRYEEDNFIYKFVSRTSKEKEIYERFCQLAFS